MRLYLVVRSWLYVGRNSSRKVTISFELGLDSRIEFSVVGSGSSVNHPISSIFVIGEDAGLNVLKVATRHTSVRG